MAIGNFYFLIIIIIFPLRQESSSS
jgi:hypothetical protein